MPEIGGDEDVTHFFCATPGNYVIEYGRGFIATRNILPGELLVLSCTKGAYVEDFAVVLGCLREMLKESCDLLTKDSALTSVKPAEVYETYSNTPLECSLY